MASEGAELDLYADDIGDEFSQENEYNDSDLYDDVITSNSKSRAVSGGSNITSVTTQDEPTYNGNSNQSQNSNHSNNSGLMPASASSHIDGGLMNSNKKPCIYVGNLTWWTTDEDIIRALGSVGVNDVHEIKFFENRANGQSKGFCVVTLNLENSVRVALDKLSKIELYGQTMAVTLCNRQNLNHFEMKSRKPGQNGQTDRMNNTQNSNQNNNFGMQNNRSFGQNQGGAGNIPGSGVGGRPPLLPRGPGLGRPNGPLLNNQPRLPQMSNQALPFGSNPQQWSQLMQNGPRNPMHNAGGPQLNPMMRMPQGNRSLANQPLLNAPTNQGDLRTQLSSVGLSGVGHHPMGGSHVNSLFGSQSSLVAPNAAADQFGNRFGLNPYGQGHPGNEFGRSGLDALALQMSEAEFEEILAKNKNLANNAVTRAVSDAASGDYHAAIDTLSTAMALIGQSRVAHDERCKIIISSLRDTLNGIEAKFSGGRKERPRSRERSRDRGSRRDKPRHRSRSREREYRERSRDRHYDDRHYDDRSSHRDRDRGRDDRDRERDHRSSRH